MPGTHLSLCFCAYMFVCVCLCVLVVKVHTTYENIHVYASHIDDNWISQLVGIHDCLCFAFPLLVCFNAHNFKEQFQIKCPCAKAREREREKEIRKVRIRDRVSVCMLRLVIAWDQVQKHWQFHRSLSSTQTTKGEKIKKKTKLSPILYYLCL